jgi:hypothetical protein
MKNFTLNKKIRFVVLFCLLGMGLTSFSQDDRSEIGKKESPKEYEGLQLKVNENWNIKFSGQVNVYYVLTEQKEDVEHGVKREVFHSLRNGINQATLSVSPTFVDEKGVKVTSTFELAFGFSNSGVDASLPQSRGFGFTSVEIRQVFIKVIMPKTGSFFVGRGFGKLGFDAIINDASLLGIGANYSYSTPRNTTLAGVGYGYIFTDKFAQFNYETPAFFNDTSILSVGIYDPFASFDIYGAFGDPFGFTDNPNNLGFHGKFSYQKKFGQAVDVYASTAIMTQKIADNEADLGLIASGFDVFFKLRFNRFQLAGYYYNTDGMGDAGLLFGPAIRVNTTIETVKTEGYYAQASYRFSDAPFTLSLHYGSSRVQDQLVNNSLEFSDSATRLTSSLSYRVNPSLTLKSEFTIQGRHKVFAPRANVFSLGGFFTF